MTTENKRLLLLKQLCSGMTQTDLAKKAGINTSYLSQLLNGRRAIGERAAKNLEVKLGLRPGMLVNPQSSDLVVTQDQDHPGSGLPEGAADDCPAAEITSARISILRALIGESSKTEFCAVYGLNPAYIGSLLGGSRNMGVKSARKLEESIGLRPGALEHPSGRALDTPEKIHSLYLKSESVMSPKALLLIKNLQDMLEHELLTPEHIDLLASMAYQLALPRTEKLSKQGGSE